MAAEMKPRPCGLHRLPNRPAALVSPGGLDVGDPVRGLMGDEDGALRAVGKQLAGFRLAEPLVPRLVSSRRGLEAQPQERNPGNGHPSLWSTWMAA
jgi:hypothetical protein